MSPIVDNTLLNKISQENAALGWSVTSILNATNTNYYKISGFTPCEVIGTNVRHLEKKGYVSKDISLMAIESKCPVTIFQTYRNGKTCMNTAGPVFNAKGEIT